MDMTLFNMDIMANLKADSITVVISRFNITNMKALTILQKYVPPVISIQVLVIRQISIQAKILDQNIRTVFAGQ